jgi:hypothetical protein
LSAPESLYGGLVDRAVRIGATVRRPAGPWTPTVHALLDHLESHGFLAPRARGIDEDGREILSYLEGDAELAAAFAGTAADDRLLGRSPSRACEGRATVASHGGGHS